MKKYLKYLFVLVLLLMLVVLNEASAAASSDEYTIQSYNIDMVVNENNTFDITETIVANFYVSKHGIYRKIPLKNTVTRNDATKSTNRAKVSNISVSENYKTYKENGYEVIKIGSSSQTYTGLRSYTIKYTYDIGKDPLKGADELYFNLIGDEWDTTMSDVTFTISMPKSFDQSLLGFSSGFKGSVDSSNVSYTVDGNVISGSLKNTLYGGQALTVRLTLPEGYFSGAGSNIDIFCAAIIIICIICAFISYRLWSKYGKDDKVIETVEFYPPERYNSAEVGFLYYGTADTKSVISLLIYLANDGYLKLEETEEKGLFKTKKGFKITKVREYDGNNEYERLFFNGLFEHSRYGYMRKARSLMDDLKAYGQGIRYEDAINMSISSYYDRSLPISVTASDLYDKFYTTLNKIKSELNSKENKNLIFEPTASAKIKWLILMIIAIFVLITVKPIIEYGDTLALLPFALIFPGIGFSFMFSSIFGKNTGTVYVNGKATESRFSNIVFGLVFGLVFGGMPWAFIVLPTLTEDPINLIMYIIGVICIFVIMIFIKIMPKRTPYGNAMLGKIKGFKRFLETAEKPQLESLVAQNPEYFYNILPYTYALGVSDVWIRQFESIAIQAPNWYDSRDGFNMHTFGTFMNTTMTSASTAMSSSPSSSGGGGGSSGGGSSGGGSGGGGGGSW